MHINQDQNTHHNGECALWSNCVEVQCNQCVPHTQQDNQWWDQEWCLLSTGPSQTVATPCTQFTNIYNNITTTAATTTYGFCLMGYFYFAHFAWFIAVLSISSQQKQTGLFPVVSSPIDSLQINSSQKSAKTISSWCGSNWFHPSQSYDINRPNLCICAMYDNNDTQHIYVVQDFKVGVTKHEKPTIIRGGFEYWRYRWQNAGQVTWRCCQF